MSNTRGYLITDFDSQKCVISGEYIFDRMGYISKRNCFFDCITNKPIAVHEGKCRKKFLKKRQRELDRLHE